MAWTAGQAAVGLVIGLALIVVAVVVLAGALLEVGPPAWQRTAEERTRARERILGGSGELRPRWQRAHLPDGKRDAG